MYKETNKQLLNDKLEDMRLKKCQIYLKVFHSCIHIRLLFKL